MAEKRHYNTTNFDIYSDDTDTEAVLYVREKSASTIVGRVYVVGEADASPAFNRAKLVCDACQIHFNNPASSPDWDGGKTGISGLGVI